MTAWRSTLWLAQTSWQECAHLGHREIDVEHVFLATLQDEGVSRVLLPHGVDAEGTRAAVGEVLRAQVDALGVETAALTSPPRRAPQDLHHGAVGTLPVTPRARELMRVTTSVAGLAARLVGEPSGTVRGLLLHQGADPDQVAADLEAHGDAPDPGLDVSTLPGIGELDGIPVLARRATRLLTGDLQSLWPRVGTAAGTKPWLSLSPSATARSETTITDSLSRSRVMPWRGPGTLTRERVFVHEPSDGAAGIALWQSSWDLRVWGRRRSGPGTFHHVRLVPEVRGTRVELVSGVVRQPDQRRSLLAAPLRPAVAAGLAIANRNALYQLGLLCDASPATGE